MANHATGHGKPMPPETPAILDRLKQCASDLTTISYGELVQGTSILAIGVGKQLEYIRDEICRKHGRPWLSVLAVNADCRRPGKGWLPSEGIKVDEPQDRERLWRGMVLQVYAYDWTDVELESE